MFKQFNSVSVTVAVVVLVAASSVMAQDSRKQSPREIRAYREANPTAPGPKSAVVALRKEGIVRLAGDREKTIEAMQRALNKGSERDVVADISILSFEKANYLAIRIEKQGTLYLQLEPSPGSIQNIYYVGDLNSLYCSGGCTACTLVPGSLADGSGPHCACAEENQGPLTDCQLHPVRRDIKKLALDFNAELLAIGFETADTSAGSSEKSGAVKAAPRTVAPGRVDPIKRPNN